MESALSSDQNFSSLLPLSSLPQSKLSKFLARMLHSRFWIVVVGVGTVHLDNNAKTLSALINNYPRVLCLGSRGRLLGVVMNSLANVLDAQGSHVLSENIVFESSRMTCGMWARGGMDILALSRRDDEYGSIESGAEASC
ncbi:hypothetical protein BO86DRAFT_170628 [Aspergillus japonicus CBS 114.51]|uniref:Uncharacterized protein n=1 Tax=Aspergillus japonicus CBS 114.51 TaxID=1448312 RepID=A0A8T8WTA4_ASPJA|nr:hypothetical protein BO86DRAFT_170628 [Aspergillus japonicus CBS 114.51]RAH79068.1 hypothetical protein BO86DRAFT_170628 [Aspergillus japonicus CBS 114.51]